MNSNNAPVTRDIKWFHDHEIVSCYFLAEFLAETYEEWVPMRDELVKVFDRGLTNGTGNGEEKTV
jgi:hypothetical protein